MKKKTKLQIDENLKEISERLRKIESSIFWYVELPIRKKLKLQAKEFFKKVDEFSYCEKGINQNYKKGDIFIRKEDWDEIKKQKQGGGS